MKIIKCSIAILKTILKAILNGISKAIDSIFPMLANCKANKNLRKKLDPKNETHKDEGILDGIDNSENITLENLKEQYDYTIKIKEKFEDKAKTNIIGVTISITLIMGASGLLSIINEKYQVIYLSWISYFLFVLAVFYMLFAGLLAIHVLIGENEVYIITLNSIASGDESLKDDYNQYVLMNQTKNLIRNNYVFTSYVCIRNALVCLLVILILVAMPYSRQADSGVNMLTHTSQQKYSFVFSSSAVEYLEENDVRLTVENAVINAVESTGKSNNPRTHGIIDKSSSLFIKFETTNKSIIVLLIEPYVIP